LAEKPWKTKRLGVKSPPPMSSCGRFLHQPRDGAPGASNSRHSELDAFQEPTKKKPRTEIQAVSSDTVGLQGCEPTVGVFAW
jgi:hypothetical protein